jgi:hypothetical protein
MVYSKFQAPVQQRGWRRLSLTELEVVITKIRREAVHRHLSVGEWRRLDRMRKRHAVLLKEGV